MARGWPSTIEEDALVREAARANYRPGGYTASPPPGDEDKPLFERYRPAEREYALCLACKAK